MPKQHKPPIVKSHFGAVVERKPDGTDISMSPHEAVETAQLLLEAASEAEGDVRIRKHH